MTARPASPSGRSLTESSTFAGTAWTGRWTGDDLSQHLTELELPALTTELNNVSDALSFARGIGEEQPQQ